MSVEHATPWVGTIVVAAILATGAYLVAVLDRLVGTAVAGDRVAVAAALRGPWSQAALLLGQQAVSTERPDAVLRLLAPAAYAGLAAAAMCVVPLSATFMVADVPAGIVLWGAAEALAIIAVFLHGWAPNSPLALFGAYRWVGLALSYELLSMFVLIAVALPAESLQLSRVVAAQAEMWNVVRQPLGLPLFLVVALGATFWGPLNLADGDDLAGGTSLDASGVERLVWHGARAAMLTTFAAMAATAFLGGWLGPWLPGPAWLGIKTAGLLVVLAAAGHLLGRWRAERAVTWLWTVALPLAFLNLVVAGLEALA